MYFFPDSIPLCFLNKMRAPNVFLTIMAIIYVLNIEPYEAARILDKEEQQWMKMGHLVLPSLQRRAVRPPSPNGCTWVGGSGGRPCRSSVSEKNFARRIVTAPPPPPPPPIAADNAYPEQMIKFGMAIDRI
ncbi:Hypothetical predicted protein [Olea europaea subsp. europaea]|uniref:Uncharacterized protein n=2 Tax=Olea europaea subsp. europaea TaxID=158383 RepID=A0A8S0URQ1_OLEEU|nr:Hypothetical predicted protein [Olea europaea subsp. europaea]